MTTPSADQLAQAVALIEAQAAGRRAITDQSIAIVTAAVEAFDDWWNSEAITDLVRRITAVLQPRQRILAGQTDAYLARMRSVLTSRLAQPVGPIPVEGLRQGATMEDAYGRLADNYRYLVSQDISPDDAQRRVVDRAATMAQTDLTLAANGQVHEFMVRKVVTGYRRVIHPELSQSGTCGLCIVASDRVYKRIDKVAMHPNCWCSVVEIFNGLDVGKHINADDLTRLYADAGSTAARALQQTNYEIRENGELGPVLTYKGQRFRGPEDVAAA